MIGSEASSTIRSRRCREKQKALQCNEDATALPQNCNTEYRDKSIEVRDKENREKNIADLLNIKSNATKCNLTKPDILKYMQKSA